ncbi:OmpA family protein [Aliisedimentitalea sp. MJ-SS2]|uniref:OmpA family protein n=1 Tax=Aliisedimentitalea sp. MJ-SS2 TaxID=3049795 RepID=UPI00292FB6E9|nr:OmpA family protein [Alisedimentitalea sp. MJ-SS2]
MALACLLLPLFAAGVLAFELSLPGNARETTRDDTSPDAHTLATAGFADGAMPLATVEGAVSRAAWRIDVQGITTLQLVSPLRDQLREEGFDILFECEAATCGGFDFRYRLEVFPAPHMHIDLFDYRYLAASRGAGTGAAEHVTILASRSSSAGFVQITTITPPGKMAPVTNTTGSSVRTKPTSTTTTDPGTDLPLAEQLERRGHAILGDLAFETGSSALGAGDFTSLAELAGFLSADPNRRVALVGHTDAVGALAGNIALSKRRAASVLERLVSAHGVPRGQLDAEGMGYLSPVTTNLTPEGRDQNRRVEAVLLNTE